MSELTEREVALFNEARRLAGSERAAYLDKACAGDAGLRQRLDELLGVDELAGDFLEKPAYSDTDAAAIPERTFPLSAALSEKPGDRIGRYKLLQQIGEGGCGVVYMAEQEEPVHRRVALKVIKLGMDTRSVIARFEAERQALALMDHPNIAKVLDAGATETGRLYFVMELVKAIPITRYCDENNLSTTTRLGLFVQVCQAVQHAHQKGIIHRDIKPSNILVADHDGVAVPKIIDFGIAKATTDQRLTDKTVFTAFEQFIGTPAYMSPEQAKLSGLDIDTRTDIYSLGVLLYELLTGKTPFEAKRLVEAGLDEIRRIIREEEPVRPSTRLQTLDAAEQTTVARLRQSEPPKLVHLIRGDLDWIVMKCLEKDRSRRYETANGLAADLQRHLHNEPVLARPPTTVYRAGKFLCKHRVAAAAVATVGLMLVGGLALTLLLLHRAEREAKKSQQVTKFLKEMFDSLSTDEGQTNDSMLVVMLADRAAARIGEELQGSPDVEADLRNTLGHVYRIVTAWERAKPMLEEALRMRVGLYGSNSMPVAESLYELACAIHRAGDTKQLTQAESLARTALEIRRRLGAEDSAVAECLSTLGQIEEAKGDLDGARMWFRQALALYERQSGAGARWHRIELSMRAAHLEKNAGRFAEAENWYRQAMGFSQSRGDEFWLLSSAMQLSGLLKKQTNFVLAERVLEETLTVLKEHGASRDAFVARESITSWERLGDMRIAQTNWAGASEAYGYALELAKAPGMANRGELSSLQLTRLASKQSSAYQAQRDYPRAEIILLNACEALQSTTDVLGPPLDLVENLCTNFIGLYAAWDKPDKAAVWRKKLAGAKAGSRGKGDAKDTVSGKRE